MNQVNKNKRITHKITLSEYGMQQYKRLQKVALDTNGWDYSDEELLGLIVRGLLKNPHYLYKLVAK